MTQQSQQSAIDRLRAAVAEETSALAAARAALAGAAAQIRDSVDDTDALNDLADALESDDLPDAIVANTEADPTSSPASTSSTSDGLSSGSASSEDGVLDPHSREGAAAAGGYDAPQGQQSGTISDASASAGAPAGSVVADTDAAAAAEGDTTDATDGDRITSQDGREAAGPFTGTGAQDALRTSGRLGDTDAHASDTRTVEEGADERTQDDSGEGQAADADAANEGTVDEDDAA